jgi:magnesium-transporting ATPase (P-type)
MGEKKFVPIGDNTEVGLLKFLQNADIPIHTEILRRYDPSIVVATVPLRSTSAGLFYTACAVDEGDGMINIHVKGAPRAVLPLTTQICKEAGAIETLEEHDRNDFLEEVDLMAGTPLRVIAFAHAEIPKSTWEQMLAQHPGYSANEVLAAELTDHNALEMKIVGALGLEDKIRPKAKSALHHAVGPDADRITVRLVSGDAKETCMAIAL